jgi:hypothetical protein
MRGLGLLLAFPLFLSGCSSAEEQPEVAEEAVTDFSEPAVEEEGVEEEPVEPGGSQPVAVELPGLPIGGEGAVFTEPSTQCLSVNLSGDALPEGVQVSITGFSVPSQFAVSSGSCGRGLPACLDGPGLAWGSGPCEVAVTWSGEPLAEGEGAALAVSSATAICADADLCESTVAIVGGAAPQAIELTVQGS